LCLRLRLCRHDVFFFHHDAIYSTTWLCLSNGCEDYGEWMSMLSMVAKQLPGFEVGSEKNVEKDVIVREPTTNGTSDKSRVEAISLHHCLYIHV
jgi:hypothetical protein